MMLMQIGDGALLYRRHFIPLPNQSKRESISRRSLIKNILYKDNISAQKLYMKECMPLKFLYIFLKCFVDFDIIRLLSYTEKTR